jgi:hypothetical protein
MLLKSPKEFERVARDWAVVYAGAPASADNGSGHSQHLYAVNGRSLAHFARLSSPAPCRVSSMLDPLLSLQSLLSTPEPKDPQDAEVANMLLKSPKEFERVARH